jgi:hypothetical protein
MFFSFVGIPDVFADRFRARFIKELSGHHFTFVPLRMDHMRTYRLSADHLQANLESFVEYSRKRAGCFDKGAAVIVMKYRWDNVPEVRSFFFPYAPVAVLEISEPIALSGNRAAVQANKIISDLHAMARSLIKPVEFVSTELRARLKRSPILLPLRRFGAPELVSLLDEVLVQMVRATNSDFIREACDRFEQSYPYQRDRRNTGKFVNSRGIDFSMPGRALHGNLWEGEQKDHTEFCLLNSRIRLGAPYDGGFHFDCTAAGEPYTGDLDNCHDAKRRYRGHPHLNVYPNDYIRGG